MIDLGEWTKLPLRLYDIDKEQRHIHADYRLQLWKYH